MILWVMAPEIGITRVKIPPGDAALQTFKVRKLASEPFRKQCMI